MTAARMPRDPEIHGAKLPAQLAPEMLHIKAGANGAVATDPHRSGWRYLSFRSFSLGDGQRVGLDSPAHESAIVTISGGGVEIALPGGRSLGLEGARQSSTAYLGPPTSPPGRRQESSAARCPVSAP